METALPTCEKLFLKPVGFLFHSECLNDLLHTLLETNMFVSLSLPVSYPFMMQIWVPRALQAV